MSGELFPDRRRASGVRFDGLDARGGRWNVDSQEALDEPDASENWRRGRAVGRDFENRGLSQESAPRGGFRKLDRLKGDGFNGGGNLVVLRQAFIDIGEVGVDEVPGR